MTKHFPIMLFTVSLLVSCVEPFNIETNDSPPVIVIYGYLTDEPAHHEIRVSSSSPYFDNSYNRSITGATVKITSSEGNVFHFRETGISGLYMTIDSVAGVPGTSYSLSVEVDFDNDGNMEVYCATSTMPDVAKVDSIEVKGIEIMGYRFYSVNLYAQDTPAEDYYLCGYKINDSVVMFDINQLSPISDNIFNGQYINGMMIQRFWDINEKERIEKVTEDNSEYRYLAVGDTLALSLYRIEKGYYDFIVQCQDEMRGENPFFGGPASNIITNISNGGLGYFTTYAFSTAETVVK